jgi:S-adenosyl methyltransferase
MDQDSPAIEVSAAHSARVYDYWLGGKDHFAADIAAGDQVIAVRPAIRAEVRANRAFLRQAARGDSKGRHGLPAVIAGVTEMVIRRATDGDGAHEGAEAA